jgi:hypothetical protein
MARAQGVLSSGLDARRNTTEAEALEHKRARRGAQPPRRTAAAAQARPAVRMRGVSPLQPPGTRKQLEGIPPSLSLLYRKSLIIVGTYRGENAPSSLLTTGPFRR